MSAATARAISRAICRRRRRWRCSPASSRSAPTARPRFPSICRPSTAPCASWRSPGRRRKVGAASVDMIVRDPVVVTASLPRFLDIGDRSRLQFDIDNVEGQAGEYKLALDIHGPVSARGGRAERRQSSSTRIRRRRSAFPSPPTASGPRRSISTSPAPASPARRSSRSASRRARPTSTSAGSAISAPGQSIDDQRHGARTLRAGHGHAVALGVAVRRHRRAGAVAGARPLPLWLLGTDGEPRDAAALRQPARQRRASRASTPISTAASKRRSTRR